MTHVLAAELLKLKRSSTWLVAVILPVLAVLTGSMNYHNNTEVLTSGWQSLASQVELFYGLFFYSVGVSLLVAVAWRAETTSWNLTATSVSMRRLLVAKTLAVVPLLATMQAIMLAGIVAAGLLLQVPGTVPPMLAVVAVLGVLGAIPLVVLQSVISALIPSFAASVALGFVGVFIALGISSSQSISALAWVVPQALITRAVSLGSTAISTAGRLGDVVPLAGAAIAVTLVLTLVGSWLMQRRLFR